MLVSEPGRSVYQESCKRVMHVCIRGMLESRVHSGICGGEIDHPPPPRMSSPSFVSVYLYGSKVIHEKYLRLESSCIGLLFGRDYYLRTKEAEASDNRDHTALVCIMARYYNYQRSAYSAPCVRGRAVTEFLGYHTVELRFQIHVP